MAAAPTTRNIISLRDDAIFGFLDDGGPNYLDRALALIGTYAFRCLYMMDPDDLFSVEEEARFIIEEIRDAPECEEKELAIDYIEKLRAYIISAFRPYKAIGVPVIVEDETFPKPRFSEANLRAIEERSTVVVDRILEERERFNPDEASSEETWRRRIQIGLVNNVRLLLHLDGCIQGNEQPPEATLREAARLREMAQRRRVPSGAVVDRDAAEWGAADAFTGRDFSLKAIVIDREANDFLFRPSSMRTIEPERAERRYAFWKKQVKHRYTFWME